MRTWLWAVVLSAVACANETTEGAAPSAGSGVASAGAPASGGGAGGAVSGVSSATASAVPRVVRGALTTELVPDVSPARRARLERFLDVRRADVAGWDAAGGGIYLLTRLANVTQLHRVDMPLGMRRQITFGSEGVDGFAPSPNAQRGGGIMVADEGGSENTQLYLLDGRGSERLFTDGKSRNEAPVWSGDGARVAYASTQRNGRDFDIWTFDPASPEAAPSLAYEASGMWTPLDWSPVGERLLALHEISETRAELAVIEKGVARKLEVAGVPGAPSPAEVAFVGGVFGPRGSGVYYLSDHGGEFRGLWYRDLETGKTEKLSGELPWDFERIVASPDRRRLMLTSNVAGWSELRSFDTVSRRLSEPVALPRGIIRALQFSPDGRRLALTLEGGRSVGDVHVLDLEPSPAPVARPGAPVQARARTTLTRWTESELGGLDPSRFHEPRLIEYPSFDGRKIPAFVYEPDGAGPHPVVISIHGGPEGQSRPFFNAQTEYLVSELGLSVVLPNVRGSTGYGRSYTLLDNGERREDSVKDIGGLLDWIDKQPALDARHVAVAGGSYGGFMSLASGAMFGRRIAAVVDMVGISSFVTFLESTKEYRRDLRRVEYGDERIPAMRELLQRISPLQNSDQIVAPLFVAQGANDPRVPLTEAEQIVQKVRAAGREVWFMLAADEGHGFQKKTNRDAFAAASVAFYEKHLLAQK